MPGLDSRPTLEAPDDDPYLWLEEIESARVLDWVEAQNAATLQRFNDAGVATDHKVLKTIFDRPDNIPFPNRRAGRLFNPWKDAANPRGVWRTTTLESFRRDTPDWDVVIDVDALATKEGEDWVWRGGVSLPPRHDRAIVQLSRGGSDAVVLREFDLSTRDFVPDGFSLPESQEQRCLARPRHAASIVSARIRHGDPQRPCAHGAAVAARERSAVGPGRLRDERKTYGRLDHRRPRGPRGARLVR